MPFQGEFYDCPPTQGDALGYVLMAFQAVSMHGFHYFRNFSLLSSSIFLYLHLSTKQAELAKDVLRYL